MATQGAHTQTDDTIILLHYMIQKSRTWTAYRNLVGYTWREKII